MFYVRYGLRRKKQWIVERIRNVTAQLYRDTALGDINDWNVETTDEGRRGISREYHSNAS